MVLTLEMTAMGMARNNPSLVIVLEDAQWADRRRASRGSTTCSRGLGGARGVRS